MVNNPYSTATGDLLDEDAIFKSLSHQIRRDIVKIFAGGKRLGFSEIKHSLSPIDSPALSYHLKSLSSLIQNLEGKYYLSPVGEAALNLLEKVDRTGQITKYRRKFIYAYVVTVLCWVAAETLVPIFYSAPWGMWSLIMIEITIDVIPIFNYLFIWRMRENK